ncbi:hypothetical protein [Janibacter terrae]|uniref:hypothetical protein n=1 Tax=Janibacter terrae TaxID=103817 RepID=UPI0014785E8A|nr:hypothetical protein [Janibacter terrae]
MTRNTIADPSAAPLGREPRFLGTDHIEVSYLGPNDHQLYRTEAWHLTDGQRVVVVSSNGGTSLVNAAELIAEAVERRWGGVGKPLVIVEDWHPGTAFGARFAIAAGAGGHEPFDHEEWEQRGLALPH